MNYKLFRANERGSAYYGWLKAKHYFSFGNWFDPTKMGFGTLRVINDDIIAPEAGFPEHGHNDFEIVTIPLEGELKHRDSLGNEAVIKKGEVQRMSAGTGIIHSEYNNSKTKELRLFQIWIETRRRGINPSYNQKKFDEKEFENKFKLIVSPDLREDSIDINQNAFFSRGNFKKNSKQSYQKYKDNNGIFILLIEGKIKINNLELETRDAIGINNEKDIEIEIIENSKILIIEIPMSN